MPGVFVSTIYLIFVPVELLNYFPNFIEQKTNSGKFSDLTKVT